VQVIGWWATDGGYAHSANYAELEDRKIDAVIPPQSKNTKPERIPARRFKYDAKHKVVRCQGGKMLRPSYPSNNGTVYLARTSDCKACPLRVRCRRRHRHGPF